MARRSKQNTENSSDPLKLIGKRIKAQREAKGLTQDQVADIIGNEFSSKMISKYENGRGAMNILTLITIANALGLTPNDLIDPTLIPNVQSAPAGYTSLSKENQFAVDNHVAGLLLLEKQQTNLERRT